MAHGGNVAVLDVNADNGAALVRELGSDRARFFEADVTDSDSIAAAVAGSVAWATETAKPLGGVIPAAGVGFPGLVFFFSPFLVQPACLPACSHLCNKP